MRVSSEPSQPPQEVALFESTMLPDVRMARRWLVQTGMMLARVSSVVIAWRYGLFDDGPRPAVYFDLEELC